jgi:hypothetical protein
VAITVVAVVLAAAYVGASWWFDRWYRTAEGWLAMPNDEGDLP